MTLKVAKTQFNNSGAWTLHQKRNLRKMLDTVYADTAGQGKGLVASTGITTGSGTLYESSVGETEGGLITTKIFIYLDGLRSTADGKIIGVDGTALDCHIGQISAAKHGTIVAAKIECLEAPVGGDPDINIYKATVGTGSESDDISGITGQGALLNYAGDFAIEVRKDFTALPADGAYMYLVAGATTDADYSAGKFVITLYGYDA
jgi:hypothetical protein